LKPSRRWFWDEGIERADDADLGGTAHVALHVVGEELSDVTASGRVVDADEGDVVAFRNLRVDGDDRNAGILGGGDRGLHTIDVDGDQNDAVDLLGDVGLDRVVLRGRHVVGVEDDEIDAGSLGRGVGAVIDLIEEQCLLVDGDECECIGEGIGGADQRQRGGRSAAEKIFGPTHFVFPLFEAVDGHRNLREALFK
jgi:hypothetical protein